MSSYGDTPPEQLALHIKSVMVLEFMIKNESPLCDSRTYRAVAFHKQRIKWLNRVVRANQ